MLERTVKLLIVRNDKIGDFILILPALSWIKKNLPNSKVVCIVSKEIHELASSWISFDTIQTTLEFGKFFLIQDNAGNINIKSPILSFLTIRSFTVLSSIE